MHAPFTTVRRTRSSDGSSARAEIFWQHFSQKIHQHLGQDAWIIALHRMACVTYLRVMPMGELMRELLCVLTGEYVAQTSLDDERGTAYLVSYAAKALLEPLTLLCAVFVAVQKAEIGLPNPFSVGILAEVVPHAVAQKPGIAARIELNGFLDYMVQR